MPFLMGNISKPRSSHLQVQDDVYITMTFIKHVLTNITGSLSNL